MGQRASLACIYNGTRLLAQARPLSEEGCPLSEEGCELCLLYNTALGHPMTAFPKKLLQRLYQAGLNPTMTLGSQITSVSWCSWGAIVFISTNTLRCGCGTAKGTSHS